MLVLTKNGNSKSQLTYQLLLPSQKSFPKSIFRFNIYFIVIIDDKKNGLTVISKYADI